MNNIEGNKLIAEFMGACGLETKGKPNMGIVRNAAKYHSSWQWLMPVVEKIEYGLKWGYEVEIGRHLYRNKGDNSSCCIIHDAGDATRIEVYDNDKITCVWLAVVEFIKWYNQQKQTV